VSGHPVNISKILFYLDFAYMIFEEVSYLDVYIGNKRYKIVSEKKEVKCIVSEEVT
jgi:hypothetical protein